MSIAVDFETKWGTEYKVSDAGVWAYVEDPRFDCYQVAIVGEGRTGSAIDYVGPPADAPWELVRGLDWVAHNVAFDAAVWGKLCATTPGLESCHPKRWSCTADLASYLQAPRKLSEAARALLGREVDKGYREIAKGKGVRDFTPAELQVVREAGLADARAALDIWRRFGSDWPESERSQSEATRRIAARGVAIDWDEVDSAVAVLGRQVWEAEQQIPWVAEGMPPLSIKQVRDTCRAYGIPAPQSLAKDSEECGEWERVYGEKHPFVAAIHKWRSANAMLKKLTLLRAMERNDGTVPVALKYFAAPHTGRWSCSLFNVQNLPRTSTSGVSLRHCIVPRPGCVFLMADLAQIEPRVLAYLGGNQHLLAQLRDGMPLYEAHARETMGWAGGSLKSEAPDLYAQAKARVLGLGYGCSASRFKEVAKSLAGLNLTEEQCRGVVQQFRNQNAHITQLWRHFERRLGDAAYADKRLEMELPSGRLIRYFDLGYDPKRLGYSGATNMGGMRATLYGAKLVENVTQATARDIFADMLQRIEDCGIAIAFHVHDEVVCEVPEQSVGHACDVLRQIMTTPPAWMPDLPLAVEIAVASRYGK